jgi:hypothetical protein
MMTVSSNFELQDSYGLAAWFFSVINIFHFSTLLQWSIFFAVIFNIDLLLMLQKYVIKNYMEYFFLLATFGVLNLYVFTLGKEILQYCVFLLLYFVVNSKVSITKKVITSASLLFIWGVVFRIYYIIIGAYTLLVYFLLLFCARKKYKAYSFILLAILGVFISFSILYFFFPSEYVVIKNIRSSVNLYLEGSMDAITIINDVIGINSSNPLFYIINFVLTLLRLMIPIEILFISPNPLYYVFFIYQSVITIFIIKSYKDVRENPDNGNRTVAIAIFIGFLLGSALFEPGYGSWIRHEAAAFPILLFLFFKQNKYSFSANNRKTQLSRYVIKATMTHL